MRRQPSWRKERPQKFTLLPAGRLNWAGDFFSFPNQIGKKQGGRNEGRNYCWCNSV